MKRSQQKRVLSKSAWRGGATLEDLLPEAFAVAREAGKRVLGMRHFDVQIMGGHVLHKGKVAEIIGRAEKRRRNAGDVSQCAGRTRRACPDRE